MFQLRHLLFCVGVFGVGLIGVNGLSDEEKSAIKGLVRPFVEQCGKDDGVSPDDIKAADAAGTLQELNPCLMSCVLKKIGIFDKEAMLDVEKATELSTKFLADEEEKKKALEIIETCSSINEQDVTDGDKGCDRAKLLAECYKPYKGQFIGTS